MQPREGNPQPTFILATDTFLPHFFAISWAERHPERSGCGGRKAADIFVDVKNRDSLLTMLDLFSNTRVQYAPQAIRRYHQRLNCCSCDTQRGNIVLQNRR